MTDKISDDMPDWAGKALAMPSRQGFIDADGCNVNYLAWGDEWLAPLVLIHGNAASAEWWRFIAPLLAADYHVIAPDLGGMGDSAHCGRYERERYAQQVMTVVDTLAPGRRPFIAGHSLGGYVAIMAACAHGDRIAGLVVIDSPPMEPEGSDGAPRVRSRPVPTIYPSREAALARYVVLPPQPVNCGFYLRHIAGHAIKPQDGGWRWKFDPAALAHPRRLDFVQDLRDMRCPAAIFWGELSERFTPALREKTRQLLGGRLPLVEIANARHHVMLDEPLALVAALRVQLANWSQRAAAA